MNGSQRLAPNDCLAELLAGLRMRARAVWPYDADAREQWLESCGQLLAAVPDEHQRTNWAWQLALALPVAGAPIDFVMALILSRAAERKAVQS
jgi:hypothetical protein